MQCDTSQAVLGAFVSTGEWFDLKIKERVLLAETTISQSLFEDDGSRLRHCTEPSLQSLNEVLSNQWFGPREERTLTAAGDYGLGRDRSGISILPSLSFCDLWFGLNIKRRITLLQILEKTNDTPKGHLEAQMALTNYAFNNARAYIAPLLQSYNGKKGKKLVRHLRSCTLSTFPDYIGGCIRKPAVPFLDSARQPLVSSLPFIHDNDELLDDSASCFGDRSKAILRHPDSGLLQVDFKPLRDSLASCRPETEATSSEGFEQQREVDRDLMKRIHSLNDDIFQLLKNTFFQTEFGFRSLELKESAFVPSEYRFLDRKTYQNYLKSRQAFISNNLWILNGRVLCTNWSFDFSWTVLRHLKKIQLRLGYDELCLHCTASVTDFPIKTALKGGPHSDVLSQIKLSRETCVEQKFNVFQRWAQALDQVTSWDLEYLELDLSCTYGPDDAYLGSLLMERLVWDPANIWIYAPTNQLADEADQIIARNYAWYEEGRLQYGCEWDNEVLVDLYYSWLNEL